MQITDDITLAPQADAQPTSDPYRVVAIQLTQDVAQFIRAKAMASGTSQAAEIRELVHKAYTAETGKIPPRIPTRGRPCETSPNTRRFQAVEATAQEVPVPTLPASDPPKRVGPPPVQWG